jgi:para-nitrobenzyl esterase
MIEQWTVAESDVVMNTILETADGVVRGLSDDGVLSFKGIPYAAPPVGDLRFAPPAAPQPWPDERDCTRYTTVSLQPPDPLSVMIPACESNYYHPGTVQGEDCLNLNVWTPALNGSRPVLVWIHGGGFLTGSGTGLWTEGTAFPRRHDLVVVTINYRLGALGFLAIEDPQSETGYLSNAGLLDQVAALRWVRQNISAFGGDPERICLFGESAGAMSVSTLLGTPAAAGLFSRAIVQSGGAAMGQGIATARLVGERFAAKLGIPYDGSTLAALRRVDLAKLTAAQAALTSEMRVPFRPVVDGHHLPISPLDAIANGSAASVPLIVGTNTDECTLFRLLAEAPDQADAHLAGRLTACFSSSAAQSQDVTRLVEGLLRTYRALAQDDVHAWDIVATDRMFRVPARELMETQSKAGGPVFSYEFGVTTPVCDGELGACHALEIPFVFGDLRKPGVVEFIGDDIAPGSVDARVSAVMNGTWAEFARRGQPVHPDLPYWPEFQPGAGQQMFFGADTRVREDPHQARTLLWIENQNLTRRPFDL